MEGESAVIAAFFEPHKPLQITKVDLSEINVSEGEILAKILYSSICGSDLHTIDGRRKEPAPSILGHEGVGEALISHRENVQTGDKFTFAVADCCSTCEMCSRGLSQKCQKLFKYGHAKVDDGTGLNGCYASHIVIRSGTYIVKIPGDVDPLILTPVNCALATVMNAVENIEHLTAASNPKNVLVQGAGLLGIYACAVLSSRGYTVRCTDVSDIRLSLVPEFGGIPVPLGEDPSSLKLSIDVVVEVCGAKAVIPQAISSLKPGGAYILVGLIHPDSHLNLTAETVMRKCLTIRGIHNYSQRHLEEAVKFVRDTAHKFPYTKLLDPTIYQLENISEAIEAAKSQKFHRTIVKSS